MKLVNCLTHQIFRGHSFFSDTDMGEMGNDAKSTAGGSESGQKRLCARLRYVHCPVGASRKDQNQPITTCFVFSAKTRNRIDCQ